MGLKARLDTIKLSNLTYNDAVARIPGRCQRLSCEFIEGRMPSDSFILGSVIMNNFSNDKRNGQISKISIREGERDFELRLGFIMHVQLQYPYSISYIF